MSPTLHNHVHNIAVALLWAHTEFYLRKFPLKANSRDIFGAGLWQNNLMHGFWQQQQQYLHTGIGSSLLSEVTHSPWITLPCSRVLWSWMLTVWPLLNVVSLLSSCSSHLHHHTFQPLDRSRKAKKIEQNRIEVVCNVSSQCWLAGPHLLIPILKRLGFIEHSLRSGRMTDGWQKKHLREIKLYEQQHGGREKGSGRRVCFWLQLVCFGSSDMELIWQSACLVSLSSLLHTGGSLVFGSLYHWLGLSFTVCLI